MDQTSSITLKNYLSNVRDILQEPFRSEMNEKDKNDKTNRIIHKLETGEELSPEDLSYLRENNPALYQEALSVQMERKSFEESLKNSRSKEEAQDKFSIQMDIISSSKKSLEYRTAAANRVWKSFVNSATYKTLPQTAQEKDNSFEPCYPCYNKSGEYN